MDADRDRTLRIEIPGCVVTKNAGEPTWTDLSALNGWSVLPTAGVLVSLYWEGTIDLSGYARDYKTFYPKGGVIQRGAFMSEVGGEGSITYTVVSSVPLVVEDIQGQLLAGTGPGFINTLSVLGPENQNWPTVLFAESEMNVPNANITPNTFGIQQPLERNQSGSMEPTAAQVLYVLKIVSPFNTIDSTAMTIPASRVLLPGTMDQEPELEYMMRLARSVELANQV